MIDDLHVGMSSYLDSSYVLVQWSSLNGLGIILLFFNRASCWHIRLDMLHLLERSSLSSCYRLSWWSDRLSMLHDLLMGTLVRYLLLLNLLLDLIDLLLPFYLFQLLPQLLLIARDLPQVVHQVLAVLHGCPMLLLSRAYLELCVLV